MTTDLLIQQGPSCWLYVVEALATASSEQTKLDTAYLRMAMYCYPDSESVDERHSAQGEPKLTSRAMALKLMVENIDGMLSSLDNWQKHNDTDELPLGKAQAFARRNQVSYSAWLDPRLGITFTGDQDAPTTDAKKFVTAFTAARKIAEGLFTLVSEDKGGNSVGALLNTGYQQIDTPDKQEATDAVLSLGVQSLPCYISVRRRYRTTPDQRQSGSVDLTKLALSKLEKTAHALLMVEFTAKGDSDGTITYKDPNYGNVLFTVTVEQLQSMAGEDGVKMRPFFASGAKKSALAKILG